MSHDAPAGKDALRQFVRTALATLSPGERAQSSQRIVERIQATAEWSSAEAVLLFWPLVDEPDVRPLLDEANRRGCTVALPVFDTTTGLYRAARVRDPERDLGIGRFGVREPLPRSEPVELNRLDFAVVPGVAFGVDGSRLGRGRGYYDRLLAQVQGLKCGVGFDPQLVQAVPVEPHDVVLEWIMTPSRWCRAGRREGSE